MEKELWVLIGDALTQVSNVHDLRPPHDLIRHEITPLGVEKLREAFQQAFPKESGMVSEGGR